MPLGIPNVFSAGQKIFSAAVNANFAAIASYINGLNIPTTPVTVANGGTGASTAPAALKNLGLATGLILPATAAFGGGSTNAVTLTCSAAAPAVSAYSEGTTYFFVSSGAQTGPFTIQDVTTSGSGLAALPLYDNTGANQVASLSANQPCLVIYSPALGGCFVLADTPAPSNSARFAVYNSTGTFTAPFTGTFYADACAGGGGGGPCNGANFSGGGGGGGGASVSNYALNLTQGQTYSVTIGSGGAGGTGSATGTAGGTTQIETSSFAILLTLTGGGGGAPGINTSISTGGAAGGSGAISGQSGYYFSGPPSLASGAGGASLYGAGGAGSSSGGGAIFNGQTAGQYGGGGGGGAGAGASGGNGAPGTVRLRW